MSDSLISPHGGVLVDLVVDDARAEELKNESRDWASWDLTERQLCDIELLMNGAFSPLTGFLAKADYESVCDNMRLADGTLWPMPIMLDVTAEVAEGLESGSKLALRDPEGVMLAVIHVEDVWEADRAAEAEKVFGSTNPEHPGVDFLMTQTHPFYVGGRVEGLTLPIHYDFRLLRRTPAELRKEFTRQGWRKIVAFQTRNPSSPCAHRPRPSRTC